MKRVVVLGILCLIFILPLMVAQTDEVVSESTIESKARSCIVDRANEQDCENFGLEDNLFALLSTGKCESELLAEAQNEECFGAKDCTLKMTSQAVLALSEANSDTTKYVDWILSQTIDVPDFEWLIQIDSPEETTSCELKDLNGDIYGVDIAEDETLTLDNTADCLTLDSTGYWLEIKPSCYEEEFEVSCDGDFLSNLLFRKKTSPVLYVLDESPKRASGGGTVILEQTESLCFSKGTSCNYEGTLWAALTLKKLGQDVSPYLAYLIAFEEDNEDLIPESFLQILVGGEAYRSDLILKQKGNRYWDEAGDRFTDTALALLPFPNEDFEAKDNAVAWLGDVQGDDGCWDSGNIVKTGFLLYSLAGSKFVTGGDDGGDPSDSCESAGNYCIKDHECVEAGGDAVSSLTCSGFDVCCTKDKLAETCADLGGQICDTSNQECSGGYEDDLASDLGFGETCCVAGVCRDKGPTLAVDTCTPAGGACRDFGCDSGEQETFLYDCEDVSQYCCLEEEKDGGLWWIWLLIILIILVVVSIIFRDKLKEFYIKFKTKKPKGPATRPIPGQRRPGMPPARRPGISSSRMPQRRLPPQATQRPAPATKPPVQPRAKSGEELDDVLKKLKEMGK